MVEDTIPRLRAFNQARDNLYPSGLNRSLRGYYDPEEAELLTLIGADPNTKLLWWKNKDEDFDLNITDHQVELCRMLAGPHGRTVFKVLKVQHGLQF